MNSRYYLVDYSRKVCVGLEGTSAHAGQPLHLRCCKVARAVNYGGRGQAQNSKRCNASARREMGCQYMGWSLHSFAGIGADALALSISIGVAPNMPQAAWSRLFGSNV